MSFSARKKKSGIVSIRKKKQWKSYRFEVNANYFLYFKTDNLRNPNGMILLSAVSKLEMDAYKDTIYPLQVHFRGKPMEGVSSPWPLCLESNEERIEWMEAILPGSSKELQRFSSTARDLTHPVSPPLSQENPYSIASSEVIGHRDSNGSLSSTPGYEPQNYLEPCVIDGGGGDQSGYANNPCHSVPCRSKTIHSTNTGSEANKIRTLGTGFFKSGNPELPLRHRQTFAFGKRETNVSPFVRSMTESNKFHIPEQGLDPGMETAQGRVKSPEMSPPNTSGPPKLPPNNLRQREAIASGAVVNTTQLYEMDPGMEAIQRQVKSPPPNRAPPNARSCKISPAPAISSFDARQHSKRHPPQLGENASFDSLFPPAKNEVANAYLTLVDPEPSTSLEFGIPQFEQCRLPGISLSQSLNLPRNASPLHAQLTSRGRSGEGIPESPCESPKPVPTKRISRGGNDEKISESPYQSPKSVPAKRISRGGNDEKISESPYQIPKSVPAKRISMGDGDERNTESPCQSLNTEPPCQSLKSVSAQHVSRGGGGEEVLESPYQIPKPVSMHCHVNERDGQETNVPPHQSMSPYQSPTNSIKPVPKARTKKTPEKPVYVELTPNNDSGDNSSDLSVFGLKPDVVRNLNADQLEMLRKMLQQAADQQPPLLPSPDGAPASSTQQNGGSDGYTDMRPRTLSGSLQTNKILVTEDDDDEGYEPRPNWAKAGGQCARALHSECDDLSDLHEEALYIPRSTLTDFIEIGEGQFGKVFSAVMQRGGRPLKVAVKTAKKSSSEIGRVEFDKEMNIMSQMRHPNIVQLHGIIRDDVPAPWIVLEYLHNGDLKHFLKKHRKPVAKLVKYMIDVSMGMHYLSEKGFVHRDLAARNILVSEDETCKISDFGMLRELPKDDSIYHMQSNIPCPVRWMSPESISDRRFSPASDVWSFGILQWEMFHPKKTPYHKLGNIEVALKVMKGNRLEIPAECPCVVARIMKACWHVVPEKRPSFLLIATLLSTKVTFE